MKSSSDNSGQEFDVGSVVYFISSKSENVIPALVSEKIVRTSQSASKVTYILQVKTNDAMKSVEVDPSTHDLFANVADVREFMIARTTAAIDKLIENAVGASSFFNSDVVPPTAAKEGNEEFAEVILEDGKVAKLRM